LKARYRAAIKKQVERAWRRPADFTAGETAEVRVRQIPSGDVTHVTIERCSGGQTFCDSVVRAVESASPLPKAPDPAVFEREIQFTFKPKPEESA
jgi:colicin import membrane protein